ncbi:hypothetical protein PV05_00377 [Exophiala xenobiotica]|uniref:Uncharacterized protein n=1 Tax=Exophiala xenobiotica TaxID=348802 RepID=A0A0D2DCW6_9EURO|nr:uncharacterized protein PV05_00377 [Exophiala xenobiotica]KIW60137.1 hypothetical protein PV05_00377 [Exophiala xenobiotica]
MTSRSTVPSQPFVREPVLAQGRGEEHSHVEDQQHQPPNQGHVVADLTHHPTKPSMQRRKILEDEPFALNASTVFDPSESILIDSDVNGGRGIATSSPSQHDSHEELDHGYVQHEEADDGGTNLIEDHTSPFLHRRRTLEDELSAVVGGNDLTDLDGSTLIETETDNEQQWHKMIGVDSALACCDGKLNDSNSEVTMIRRTTSEDDRGFSTTASSVHPVSDESNNVAKQSTHTHTHLTSTVPIPVPDLNPPASSSHRDRNPLASPPTTLFLELNKADLLSWHAHLTELALLPPSSTTHVTLSTHADAMYRWITSSVLPYIAAMERYTHTIAMDNEKLIGTLDSLRRQIEDLSACYEREVKGSEGKSRILEEVADMLGAAALLRDDVDFGAAQ